MILDPGEVEDRQQLDLPARLQRQAGRSRATWSAGRRRRSRARRDRHVRGLCHSPHPRSDAQIAVLDDFGKQPPAAAAFVIVGLGHRQRARPRVTDETMNSSASSVRLEPVGGDDDLGLEARADDLVAAQRFDRLGHRRAQRARGAATWRSGHRRATASISGHSSKWTLPPSGIARAPHFLGGEHQHRRGPADQRVEQGVEHGAVGAALGIVGGVAVEAVLADIEEEGAQILVAEVAQRAD